LGPEADFDSTIATMARIEKRSHDPLAFSNAMRKKFAVGAYR
jgi:hypothetical protein